MDSLEIAATLHNTTRKLKSLSWAIGRGQDTLETVSLSGISDGAQSLQFANTREGAFMVFARVLDDAGSVRVDSIKVVGNTAPKISGNPDSIGNAAIEYRFAPTVTDPDKDTLHFTITNKPEWCTFDSTTGILSGTPINKDAGIYPGIVIAVNDGRKGAKTSPFGITIRTNPWSRGPKFPGDLTSARVATFEGKIYLFQRYSPIWILDPVLGSWTKDGTDPFSGNFNLIISLGGKFLAFNNNGVPGLAYDPILKTTERRASFPGPPLANGTAVNGIFYYPYPNFGIVWAYDPLTDAWVEKGNMPNDLKGVVSNLGQCIGVGGKLLLTAIDLYTSDYQFARKTFLFDPTNDSWTSAAPTLARIHVAMGAIGNKAYVVGGTDKDGASNQVQEFDLDFGTWKQKTPMPIAMSDMAYAEAAGKLYLFNVSENASTNSTSNEFWVYDPAIDQ
ncbi:MAG: putative Ig domain-containing protein [Fibrobacterota bacterium]|nr:putative Ig domain-containing protein [Fibrobacterota bacterium]